MFKNRRMHRLLAELSSTWLFDAAIDRDGRPRQQAPAPRPPFSLVKPSRDNAVASLRTGRRTPATFRAARSG
jgi:hypothetical protein